MAASGNKKGPLWNEYINEEKIAMSQVETSISDFISFYYENYAAQKFDVLGRLYSPAALLTWNGNPSTGPHNIMQYLTQLPKAEHTVLSCDTQRIEDNTGQKKFIITTSGFVQFTGYPVKTFFHTFIISAIGETHKITVENYRNLEGTP